MRRVVRVVWSDAWWSRHDGGAASFRVPTELVALHRWPERFSAAIRVWAGAAGSGEDVGPGLVSLGRRYVTVTHGAFGLRVPARLPGQLPGDPPVDRPPRIEVLFVIESVNGEALRAPIPDGPVLETEFASQFQTVACRLRFWRWPHPPAEARPNRALPPRWFARWHYAMDRCGTDEPYVGFGALTTARGAAGLRWAETYALDGAEEGWLDAPGTALTDALARVGEAPPGVVELRRAGSAAGGAAEGLVPRFRGGPWGSSENLLWRNRREAVSPPLPPRQSADVLVSALDTVLQEMSPEDRRAVLDGVDAVLALHQRR